MLKTQSDYTERNFNIIEYFQYKFPEKKLFRTLICYLEDNQVKGEIKSIMNTKEDIRSITDKKLIVGIFDMDGKLLRFPHNVIYN